MQPRSDEHLGDLVRERDVLDLLRSRQGTDAEGLTVCWLPISASSKPTCSRRPTAAAPPRACGPKRKPTRCPTAAAWPSVYFWMAAAPRTGAPDRYYVALNLSGYRSVPPTGPFWDPVKKQVLERGKWPKGKPGQPLRHGVPHRRLLRGGSGLLSPLRPRAGQRPSAVADRTAAPHLDRLAHHRELPRRVSIAVDLGRLSWRLTLRSRSSRFRSGCGPP